MRRGITVLAGALWLHLLLSTRAGAEAPHRVRIVTDEAEAALAILQLRGVDAEVPEAAWQRLWSSEGYRRLKRRQESFGATAVEEGFREYLLSPEALAAAPGIASALARWRGLDLTDPLERAAAYLPDGFAIRATVYPVVKRSDNSFVVELQSDPAIFFYLDPAASAERIASILAHELHHVGTVSCAPPEGVAKLTPGARAAVDWLGGFLEGVAVLAAAGGPDHHPHAASQPREWIVWQRDVVRTDEGVAAISAFLEAVIAGGWTAEEQQRRFLVLINADAVPQGPFYTVGWQMASVVEKAMGREAVVRSVCDPRRLLVAFDEVSRAHPRPDGRGFATWPPALLRALGAVGPSADREGRDGSDAP